MVRETRHLWVGNLPDAVREDRIRDHFKRYGRVQSVKLVAAGEAAVAFMDIRSAAKAHQADHALDERALTTVYYEPAAIPSPGSSGASSCGTAGAAGTTGGYSASSSSERARTRDRLYRNGPTPYTNSIAERNSHPKWYNNYAASPTSTSENLGIVSTGSTEGTTLGRRRGRSGSSSGSGSTSRSVSSSSGGRSASSSSSRTSSPSGDHRRKHQWPSSGVNNKPLAICVRNLPQRSSDSSLKDGLFHEYKKHGKVSWVKVSGVNQDRYAVVCFKKHSDVEKALEVSQDKSFFGCKISVGPYQGMDVEDNESRPYETDLDEFHPKATRTLFIGNLEKDVTPNLLREKFKHYGKIIEIDIKKQSGGTSGYAFCQYANISSVVDAIRNMDGEHVGVSRVKLGFGKSMATSCIWIDGVTDLTEKQVFAQCARIGTVSQVSLCNGSGHALVVFEQVASAQQAVKELRGLNIRGRKLQVDFASRECQDAFYEQLEKQNNNPTSAENRVTTERFPELPARVFDEKSTAKYNRYDSSPRARQVLNSRSRSTRFLSQTSGEHFDGSVPDFSERRFRYEDFSGTPTSDAVIDTSNGSGVTTNGPALQSVVVVSSPVSGPSIPPPQLVPNMRHLQKERVHLLEQLEECPSSGDELISPKKRLKAERSSLGRRPSGEASSRHHRDVSPCVKRRRGSETSRHHWHTPSPVSRPGTPLHDERPDSPVPTEPRRPILIPRRSVPMCLPLPRFAAQVLPRAVPISPPRPPAGPPPPASPTSRLLSPASSTGSSPSPAEPSLDERIRSLDERYEKWSGSRVSSFSENTERTRFRHHLLDLDVTEVQPSDVMRSVLAKRSVFDEDSKRLESICDKYETPIRTICAFPSPSGARVSPSPLNSPQSAGRSPFSGSPSVCPVKAAPPAAATPQPTPAKGLQYPFPSHPPVVTTLLLDGTVAPSSLTGEFLEESNRSLSVERLSSSNVDSNNIPRNNSNTPSCSERVPVSVSYNTDSVSNLSSCVQSSNSQKAPPRSVSLKCESKTPKTSEYKTSSNKDNSILNISELDVIDEGDIKTKCGVVNSDNLDRRKNEYIDNGQINVKDNRDQSFIQKHNSENPKCDLIKSEEIAISTCNIKCDTKMISDSENWNINTTDKILETSERRKLVKDEIVKLISDKDCRRTDSDKNKVNDYKDKSNDNFKASSIDRLSSVEMLDSNCIENVNDRENSGKERLENERREHEQMNREKLEKERIDKERKEKEKIERERLDKDRREKDKLEQVERERIEKELIEKERREKEKVERERREKEKSEKDRREKDFSDRVQKERHDRDKQDKDRQDREKVDKHEKSDRLSDNKSDKHDKRKEKENKKRDDKDSLDYNDTFMSYKDRRREKDDHQSESSKHRHRESNKKDSHSDRNDTKKDSKNHESKYKDANRKSSRDEVSREIVRKDSSDSTASRNSHDSNKSKEHDHAEKDDHRNSIKSSKHDSHKSRHHDKEPSIKTSSRDESDFLNESSKNGSVDKKDRSFIESDKIHPPEIVKDKKQSIDDKQRHYSFDSHNDHRSHELKRKERLNSSCSLPASVGLKRRVSSHDNLDHDDCKRPKLNDKKLPERRDSKDSSKYLEKYRHKSTKNNISKQLEDKIKDDRKNSKDHDEKLKNREYKEKEFIEKETSDTFSNEKDSYDPVCNEDNHEIKDKESREHSKSKSIDKNRHKKSNHSKDNDSDYKMDTLFDIDRERDHSIDKEFLERLELRSSLEDEKQLAIKKELKERKRLQQIQQIQQLQKQTQQTSFQPQDDKKVKSEDSKKEIKEKRISTERKSREDPVTPKIENIRKKPRKLTNSSDSSDSDEPKKHSIFDIVDEGPTYISMYDKVKARSCKNMQKQEEEKRQEKIKAKFSQLKQSRAKREEKKRSTSWDEDSDSDREHKKSSSKSFIASSSEDEYRRRHRENNSSDSENDNEKYKIIKEKMMASYDGDSTDDTRNKLISRKNSRSRIMSDTSDDEALKRDFQNSNYIDYDTKRHLKTLQKENCDEIKSEILDNMYEAKLIKDEINKCTFYETSKTLQTLIEDKKSIENDFIKNEHYIKSEPIYKYNSKYSDTEYDIYSEEPICSDSIKTEIRKKHKKKQKRQKNYTTDDDTFGRYDKSLSENLDIHSKRKHINKKDKKRERSSIDEIDLMKSKLKMKKAKRILDSSTENRSENNNFKRGERMHDIFGPLSDDCDDKVHHIFEPVFNKCDAENKEMPPSLDLFNIKEKNHYFNGKLSTSDSDCNIYSKPISNLELIQKDLFKDEIKKRKDKKRKDRKSIIKEDDNSLDVDAAGKAIEASLCADAVPESKKSHTIVEKPDPPSTKLDTPMESDVFRFTDGDESRESSMVTVPHNNTDNSKKEIKEKKKKKKKNKEDRQNRKDHHHHHHHHRERSVDNDIKIPIDTGKIEINTSPDIEKHDVQPVIECKPALPSPSLPRLIDSPPLSKEIDNSIASPELEITTSPKMPTNNKIGETRRISDKFIPGFGVEIDDNISETAVKSISDFDNDVNDVVIVDNNILNSSSNAELQKSDEKIDEKPRAIISQEETEDAVAALLGESFGSRSITFNDYNENTQSPEPQSIVIPSEADDSIPDEEAEEMRQAVQNLNASELEIKPDTPQSENDLQIDTDTDDETKVETQPKPANNVTQPPTQVAAFYEGPSPSTNEEQPSIKILDNPPPKLIVKEEPPKPKIKDIAQPKLIEKMEITTPPPTVISKGWSLGAHKPNDQPLITNNPVPSREDASVHLLLKTQTINVSGQCRPLIATSTKVGFINPISRPTTIYNTQPPTIKIPDQHVIYQRQPSILISPRMAGDIRLHSPKSHQHMEIQPKGANMTILTTGTPTLGSPPGLASSSMQQRSPGQITLVRMQQPPLSPIQTSQLSAAHQNRTMLSPGHHNTVVIQNQNSPVQINRLPITPVLTPIAKPIIAGNINVHQPKPGMSAGNTTIIQTPKLITPNEVHKVAGNKFVQESVLTNTTKLLLSPPVIVSSQNSPVMVQNRLVSVAAPHQNATQVPILVTSHLLNKAGLNIATLPLEKTDSSCLVNGPEPPKSAIVNNQNYNQTPHLHVNHIPSSPVIQNVPKAPITLIQELPNISKPVSTIQNLSQQNVQRIITPVVTNIIQVEHRTENPSPVITPIITKPSSIITNAFSAPKPAALNIIEKSPVMQVITPATRPLKITDVVETANKIVKPQSIDKDIINEPVSTNIILPPVTIDKPKCETDFEELLKPTAIVNKIEKPPHMVPNNNLINIPNDIGTDKKDIKTEIIRPNETSVISNKENNKHVSNIDNKAIINPKEDCDFWSAKDINIESVIKKVDALCGASEISSDIDIKNGCLDVQKPLEIKVEKINHTIDLNPKPMQDLTEELFEKFDNKMSAKRGGRSRGRKIQDRVPERVQTRLGNKLRGTTAAMSKRGRGRSKVEKSTIPPSTNIPGDVYDFHEDSGDEVSTTPQTKTDHRPRLILTIKSPLVANTVPNSCNPLPAVLPPPPPPKETNTPGKALPASPVQSMTKEDKIEDFVSPTTNTRKSRRLQEKDVPKNTVDDVIEDVIKNSSLQGRSSIINKDSGPIRRSARQNLAKLAVNEKPNSDVRKSPRSIKKSKDRRISETSVDSSDEKVSNKDASDNAEFENKSIKINENIPKSTETDQVESVAESTSNEVIELPKKIHPEVNIKLSPPHITEPSPVIVEKVICDNITPSVSIDDERKTTPLTADPEKDIIKTQLPVEVPIALKIAHKKDEIVKPKQQLTIKNSEELMIDPVSGELVFMRHSDDGNFVPVSNAADPNVITRLSTITSNAKIIPDPKICVTSPIIKQQTCITVTPTVLTSTSDNAVATSVLKSLTPTIQVATPRLPVNTLPAPTSAPSVVNLPVADLKIINPIPSAGLLTTVNMSNAYQLNTAPIQSLPAGSINVISRPNTQVPSIQIPLNHHVLGKSQVISSAPIPLSNMPGVNLQQNIKPPTGNAPHAAPLSKIMNPESVPKRLQQNLPSKIQPGQQLKTIPMQPHIAPQKQVQGMQMGQAGGLGPGPVGPSLPRGAQGQHASPPLMMAKHMAIIGPQPVITGASSSRISLTAVPSISPQGQAPMHTDLLGSRSPPPAHQQTSPVTPGEGVYSHFGHQHYQQYLRPHQEARTTPSPYTARSPHGAEGSEAPSPPLELRRPPCARVPHSAHSPSLSDRSTDSPQVAQIYSLNRPPSQAYAETANAIVEPPNGGRYYESPAPPPAHVPRVHHPCAPPPPHHRILIEASVPAMPKMSITQGPGLGVNIGGSVGEERGPSRGSAPAQGGGGQVHITPGPPHASHAPREADSLMMLLNRYPVMWQGLLALKNDAAAVQMHFVHGNPAVAGQTLLCNADGSTPPLRIAQRMRLEPVQLEAVARKMQMENEHCMLLALPCGRDHLDVLQQSTKLTGGFITYLQRKQAAGIVNCAPPGHNQAAYTVHIFPSCEFANENLERIAPDLLHRVADIAHLLIVIATV